jgi:hypothetical protein
VTVDQASDYVERNYGGATEYERALQELVDDLRKRVARLEPPAAAQLPLSVQISGLKAERDLLLAELDHYKTSLLSYRVTSEDVLGIKIPESEGPFQFARCLIRRVRDGETGRKQL